MIEPLDYQKAWWTAVDLRLEDRRELRVTRDPDDVEALVASALESEFKWAAMHDFEEVAEPLPVFAFGAKLFDGGRRAHVWGFGTPYADSLVLRGVTRFIKRSMVPLLVNSGVIYAQAVSHPENTTAHRWLQRLGFSLKATVPGVGGRKEDMLLFVTSADVHQRNLLLAAAA